MNYLFDTNALIYLLKGKSKQLPITDEDNILISFITKIELLSHNSSPEEEKNINKILDNYSMILIDDDLINRTVDIRKNFGLKLPDSIIAATALRENATLITSDSQIIKKAPDMNIQIFNPLDVK
jgi:predicted nucleic acid-binding protein